MRSRKNQLWAAVAILVIAGGILTAVLLRKRAAPDAVRLLPESDAVLYVNLEPIRLLTDLGKTPPKERDPQYEEFVRQTGFEFERDLDKAAFAIHYGVPVQGKPARRATARFCKDTLTAPASATTCVSWRLKLSAIGISIFTIFGWKTGRYG